MTAFPSLGWHIAWNRRAFPCTEGKGLHKQLRCLHPQSPLPTSTLASAGGWIPGSALPWYLLCFVPHRKGFAQQKLCQWKSLCQLMSNGIVLLVCWFVVCFFFFAVIEMWRWLTALWDLTYGEAGQIVEVFFFFHIWGQFMPDEPPWKLLALHQARGWPVTSTDSLWCRCHDENTRNSPPNGGPRWVSACPALLPACFCCCYIFSGVVCVCLKGAQWTELAVGAANVA